MSTPTKPILYLLILLLLLATTVPSSSSPPQNPPKPKPWPTQFLSVLIMKFNNTMQVVDLWYDYPNGRNFNIIQYQLGKLLYDLEWNNGTSYFYTLDGTNKECSSAEVGVGILRPDWLVDGANYLGQRRVDGFLCNVWEKAQFLTYYEDVVSQRPALWVFYTGREAHVMTFEVGAFLETEKWQVPAYCFDKNDEKAGSGDAFAITGAHGVLKGAMMPSL